MKKIIYWSGLFCLLMQQAVLASEEYTVAWDDWARPRSAAYIIELPAVKAAVQAWTLNPQQFLQIQYPGGETGVLWSDELADWLTSLGVPQTQIRLLPGSARADQIILSVQP
ncbi:MAG: hypothetical protein H0W44_08785 [Gammaproteobacteria bacterium]|nr:hypothetical protein [Gammaproteobacteria bacterium]